MTLSDVSKTLDSGRIEGPVSAAQRDQLVRAHEHARKILGAGRVATFNGWNLAVAGIVTLLLGGFGVTSLVLGLGLCFVAWNELRGRDLLRRFDRRAPSVLGRNQLTVMFLLISYCLWTMFDTWAHPSADLVQIQEMLGLSGDLVTELALRTYAAIILVSMLVQGLNARYYFARTALLQSYLNDTPAWIVDLQRIAPTRP